MKTNPKETQVNKNSDWTQGCDGCGKSIRIGLVVNYATPGDPATAKAAIASSSSRHQLCSDCIQERIAGINQSVQNINAFATDFRQWWFSNDEDAEWYREAADLVASGAAFRVLGEHRDEPTIQWEQH